MPERPAARWALVGAIFVFTVIVVGSWLVRGTDQFCPAPRHWVATYCSKGCMYECRR